MQGGRERLRSWWQKIKRHRVGVTVLILVVVVALIIVGYRFNWTGFNGYDKVSIATETTSSPQKITRTEEYQPGKALWDWLQLLIVPLVLAIGGFWLSQIQKTTEQRSTTDNQREAALQAYIDKISELLLKEHLGELLPDGKADQKYRQQQNDNIKDELKPEYEAVRTIARVRTLTVLRGLDAIRKASALQFLHESGLIDKNKLIISLRGADLSGADLSGASLHRAILSGANLSGANLYRADLYMARLSGANLRWADLSGANLYGANLFMARLSGANLSGSNLYGVSLSGADLSGADLSEANLSGVHLNQADLSGANLSRATGITIEGLEKEAKSLQGATMPDETTHP